MRQATKTRATSAWTATVIIGDELPLHLPHERDGPAEAEEAQAQEVEDELANRDARRCVVGVHGFPPGWWANVTLDIKCSNRYIATMRWLMLLATLPPTPTRHRVGVWRKLQRMGAVRLRGSAWILPETAETTELFQWLVQEIRTSRGEGALVPAERLEHT